METANALSPKFAAAMKVRYVGPDAPDHRIVTGDTGTVLARDIDADGEFFVVDFGSVVERINGHRGGKGTRKVARERVAPVSPCFLDACS